MISLRGHLVFALLCAGTVASAKADGLMCHIHLSADHPRADGKPRIIWNVGDQQICAARNAAEFERLGRCHCSFSNEWELAPQVDPVQPSETLL